MGKVALVRHTVFRPSERFFVDQARALPTWEATVVTRDVPQDVPEDLPTVAMSSGRLRYRLLGDPRPLMQTITGAQVDVIHGYFGAEGVASREAARRLDIPHVVTFHGSDATLPESSLLRSGKPALIRLGLHRKELLRGPTIVIAVSRFVESMLEKHGMPPGKAVVIPCGVDTTLLRPTPVPNQPSIVFVGRLTPIKGADVAIHAVARLVPRHPDVRLTIIGDGPQRAQLEALADSLGIRSRVRFAGFLAHNEALDEMRNARVLCAPSQPRGIPGEGLGQMVLEAGALGRPVVASWSGGLSEGVLDGVTGLLAPVEDIGGVAERLDVVLRDDALARAMAQAGRQHVVQNYDLRHSASRLEDVYASAL